MRLAGFFLMFAPAGAALSVDRLVRIWRGKEDARIKPRSPWAQRMIQFELSILYFASFCWKVQGVPWINGSRSTMSIISINFGVFPCPRGFPPDGTQAGDLVDACIGIFFRCSNLD